MVNNVIGVVNYVIAARPSLRNFMIADSRRFRRLLALLRSPDLSVLDTSATPSQTRPEAELVTPQPGAATPSSDTDPNDDLQVKRDKTAEQRWAALVFRSHAPGFMKRYARRRMDVIAARDTVRYFRSRDLTANEETRIPNGERVCLPVIWLTELYTPTTLVGLLDGLERWLAKSEDVHSDSGDLTELVRRARRRGGGAWQVLPYVFPPDSELSWPGGIIDTLPEGVAFARLSISTLTSTITAVTAAFRLDEGCSERLVRIINQDKWTRTELLSKGGFTIRDVRWQKYQAANAWRAQVRDEAARWLAERLPGSFHRLAPGQLPTIELLLTERQPPWEELAEGVPRTRGWPELLDLEGIHGYWQCTSQNSLRLRERRFHVGRSGQRHIFTLAALRQDFIETSTYPSRQTKTINEVLFYFDLTIMSFVNSWALTALLRELEEQLTVTRDLTERASSKRSPQAITRVQRQLIRTGMDSQIVAADISRYAESELADRRPDLDFTEVLPSAIAQRIMPQESLAETLLKGQIDQGRRVTRAESDMRDLLNTSAQLAAAAENLRLQRRVWWLAFFSLLVAIVAAAAAVVAVHISGGTPAPRAWFIPACPRPSIDPPPAGGFERGTTLLPTLTPMQPSSVCPVPSAHRRLMDCHVHWHAAADAYMEPESFRLNLNALIQSLRNVTFLLQSQKRDRKYSEVLWQGRWCLLLQS